MAESLAPSSETKRLRTTQTLCYQFSSWVFREKHFMLRNINNLVGAADLLPMKRPTWIISQATKGTWDPQALSSLAHKLCANDLAKLFCGGYITLRKESMDSLLSC